MDYKVEATLHLHAFPDEEEVRRILRAHDFRAEELSGGRLRVFGSFLGLKAVRARLVHLQTCRAASRTAPQQYRDTPSRYGSAPLHHGETLPRYGAVPPRHRDAPPWYGSAPSGAVPRLPREPLPQYDSAPSPSEPPRHQQSPPSQSILVDANVFHYALQLRGRDIRHIEASGDVCMDPTPMGEMVSVSLRGRGAGTAGAKLRRLFEELDATLRTQEVWLREVAPAARPLLNTSTHGAVLLRRSDERVCLVGPSAESYELKQRLLGKPPERSGRRGRSLDRSSGRRSNSVPPPARRKEEPQRDAAAAHAYSPSKYQDRDDKEGGATARPDRSASARERRSHSESRRRDAQAPTAGAVQQSRPKLPPVMKALVQITNSSILKMKPHWRP